MECYQTGCGERAVWQVTLSYRPGGPDAPPVVFDGDARACWQHRAQLLRQYGGARGATKIESTLRSRGVDPSMTSDARALLTPIFG
jgi:hypothetical protein